MKNRRCFFWLAIPLLFAAMAGLVMLLWNAILPDLFRVGRISYFQAFGLLILSRILLGGFRLSGRNHRPPFGGPPPFRRKDMHFSEEDRQKLRDEWKKRCQKRDVD